MADQPDPLGFRPWEITALVNQPVVRKHAEEASFLWSRRRRAANDAAFDLASLSALDRRVEAHLAGLLQAGSAGWSACRKNLEDANAGTIFALGAFAFSQAERSRMRDALLAATASEELVPGLISALGWLEPGKVAHPIALLMSSAIPIHRVIGVRALALHRFHLGKMDPRLDDPSPEVRAATLRYFGECMRQDSVPSIQEHLSETNDRCRFWAAWSLTLLTGYEGVQELLEFVDHDDARLAYCATDLVVRVLPASEARTLLRRLATHSQWVGLAEAAVGALGDSTAVPWLIERMSDVTVARAAGVAFTAITGVHLAKADLTWIGSTGFDDKELPDRRCPSVDEALSLPVPSTELATKWWSANAATFPPGTRLLGGRPIDRPNVIDVLRHGNQLLRRAAAFELARLVERIPLFDARARGRYQQAVLDSWTS